MFLPDLPPGYDRGDTILWWVLPTLMPRPGHPDFPWFAGVWSADGVLIDSIDLPPGMAWEAGWSSRLDSLWDSPDGRHRLAATAGSHDTLIVAGVPLEQLDAAKRDAIDFHVKTLALWGPLVVGIACLALVRALAPLSRIAETARRIRAGSFERRLDVAHADAEFVEVAGTINDMLDRLESIRQSQSRFNADVAHQLMNPVHSILLEVDAADPTRPAEVLSAALGRTGALARRIEAICEVLLAYSRSAALDPSRLERIDLEPIIAAAVDRASPLAGERGITIVSPAGGVVVRGDAALLEEVFVNLLVNAVEHSPSSGRIEIECGCDSAGCRVAVVDHGAGVAADDLPKLFERFHSGKPSGGHGIGLALSQRILHSHGGDLVHEPTAGGGATFVARFPAVA